MKREALQERLLPLVLITTFLGIVLGAVESVTKFLGLLDSQLYLLATALYAGTLLLVRAIGSGPGRGATRRRKWRWGLVMLATLGYGLSVGWTYYDRHWRTTGPAERPDARLSRSAFSSWQFIGSAQAQTPDRPAKRLVLEDFYLDDRLSTFTETEGSFAAAGGPSYRTFAFDTAVAAAFARGTCVGPRGERPAAEVLAVLRKRAQANGNRSLLNYVATPADLSRVIRERGDIFAQLMPSNEELLEMQRVAPADYDIVRTWLLSCVGVYNPVITLVLKNVGATALTLTEIVYDVAAVGEVKGGITGPLYPEVTYDHTLEHRVGAQSNRLTPLFRINPADNAAISLRLFSAAPGPGQAWLLAIRVVSSEGDSVTTEPFQIIMSK